MAQVSLRWSKVRFPAAEVSQWKHLKHYADDDTLEQLRSEKAVYVIRSVRPFAFIYDKGRSPVVYIGKGDAPTRIRSHLGGWMRELSRTIPGLEMEIWVCTPRVRKSGPICEDVEADLIDRFIKSFGERPLNNIQKPRRHGKHTYPYPEQLTVLRCGKGPGFYWALRPMKSSLFAREIPVC